MQTSRHAINISSKRSLSHIILNRGWSPVSHSRSKLSLFSTFKNGLTWYFSKIYWRNDNCLLISLLGAAAPVAGQAGGSMTHGRTASHHNQQLKVEKLGHELYPSLCTSSWGIPFPQRVENFRAPSAQEGANTEIKSLKTKLPMLSCYWKYTICLQT